MVAGKTLLLLATPVAAGPTHKGHGYKSSRPWLPRENVGRAPAAETLVAEEALPASLDYRDINGQNMVTSDWNQHIPEYCGACWIHGTLSTLSDRIKIMRNAEFPDVRLGRQSIMNCVPAPDGKGPPPGCDGGDSGMIHKYMHETRVPDESCMPYQARNMGCTADTICRNCLSGSLGCWKVPGFVGYGVSSYGFISGEKAMMKEILARGPIACSFATDDEFMYKYSENVVRHEGVYVTRQNKTAADIDHVMEIAGWGETPSGRKYWVIRNSWGTYWGEAGWAKLERGVDALMSESDCAWAVPTWDGLDQALASRTLGDYWSGQQPREHYEAFLHRFTNVEVGPGLGFALGLVVSTIAVSCARKRQVQARLLMES